MPARIVFKKNYIDFVRDVALANGKVSNRMIAKRLAIDEKTIRNWRREYYDFDRAFGEALSMIREKIIKTAVKNLDVRKMKTINKTPDGESESIKEIHPTHNDIAVFEKIGLSSVIMSQEEEKICYLQTILERKNSGEITPLQAGQLIEIEGIPVPNTLLLEIKQASGLDESQDIFPSVIQVIGGKFKHDENSNR
ncbi:helix-turn-helix domain-containing protein (plasmid) [Arsenophonus nasoniae]|uniref:Helix-turn-helix domain-containing protein n=1 Tax=Arsenophonus nasoniae TaxID=638 RepID=A0A4P7KZS2_9GAMM|nr:helix-turn-helix domain-containing protein [Arsenophonus nasoniae]QBY45875.1 hypothetical protein ArsFIN_44860 [Arsenophonus nasoniae]QBY46043.1 hypothetical protein ArsFIN_46540 [Arsenophonus nasoniae]WGM08963.1 helix-turn-helix domain-containing protein [Arsenophonus nasoniae]WGM13677.1 helix-turn-helix domain-containing protein [Arsenophonus nasoniae]WGM18297.1 helix-turn-helix domain-containing protein [Arsenophonus nasoniae]